MRSSNTSEESERASLGMFSPRFIANFNCSNENSHLSKIFLGPNGLHSYRPNWLLRFLTRNGPRTEDYGIQCFWAYATTRMLKMLRCLRPNENHMAKKFPVAISHGDRVFGIVPIQGQCLQRFGTGTD